MTFLAGDLWTELRWKSKDGKRWTPLLTGWSVPGYSLTTSTRIAYDGEGTWVGVLGGLTANDVAHDNGLVTSTDDGATWQLTHSPGGRVGVQSGTAVSQVLYGNGLFFAHSTVAFLRSNDGLTWEVDGSASGGGLNADGSVNTNYTWYTANIDYADGLFLHVRTKPSAAVRASPWNFWSDAYVSEDTRQWRPILTISEDDYWG